MCNTCWRKWYNFTEQHQRRPIIREIYLVRDFPGGSAVKNTPANAGDAGGTSLIPGSGRVPRGGHGNPLQFSCLENPMDRRCVQTTDHRVRKNQTCHSGTSLYYLLLVLELDKYRACSLCLTTFSFFYFISLCSNLVVSTSCLSRSLNISSSEVWIFHEVFNAMIIFQLLEVLLCSFTNLPVHF